MNLGTKFTKLLALSGVLLSSGGKPTPDAQVGAQDPPRRILLVPLDSRPASAQFPQLIGDIGSVRIEIPPAEILGRFTTAGKPEEISAWLLAQDYSNVSAVIISADMLAYGGLIASRVPDISTKDALARLRVLSELRQRRPQLQIYVFSAVMRTAPTATRETRNWRMSLARYEELSERYSRTRESRLLKQILALRQRVPAVELEKYRAARIRNLDVEKALLEHVKDNCISYLVIGADDAQKFGPQYPETQLLRKRIAELGVTGSTFFCEGVDQHANLLVSRSLLREARWSPRVYVKISDAKAALKPANYESQPLGESIRDQIIASGAMQVYDPKNADYTLYLNAPGTKDNLFKAFAVSLSRDVERSLSVAVADINFDKQGSADSRLISELWRQQQAGNLLAFAGWNTAGNTIGTAIPHSNVYLLAKRLGGNPVEREKAQRIFLLHRLVNDYGYHKYVRPAAYKLIEDLPGGTREEAYGRTFQRLQDWVARNTKGLLEKYFREQFEEKYFDADGVRYRIAAIKDINVTLPWPRAFEVRIDFDFVVQSLGAVSK